MTGADRDELVDVPGASHLTERAHETRVLHRRDHAKDVTYKNRVPNILQSGHSNWTQESLIECRVAGGTGRQSIMVHRCFRAGNHAFLAPSRFSVKCTTFFACFALIVQCEKK